MAFRVHQGHLQLKMISKRHVVGIAALVMVALVPQIGAARSITAEFVLDAPKSNLDQKLFLDRARLKAQAQMLNAHFAGLSFVLSSVKDPHQDRLKTILRNGFYQSVEVTGFTATKRKKIDDEWHFAFVGNIPDERPKVSDADLVAEIHRLIAVQSPLITPVFAIELALAYADLDLFDGALQFWRTTYVGHSHAMLPGQPALPWENFEYSARPIKADMMPSDLNGMFALFDQAPFNPYLCRSALPMLETAQLPALVAAFYSACLTLEKTSPQYSQIQPPAFVETLSDRPSSDRVDAVVDEKARLMDTAGFDGAAWLTNLIINSLGTVPARFEMGDESLVFETPAQSDSLELESLDFDAADEDTLQLEPIMETNLQEMFQSFAQAPTLASMRQLSISLEDAGYPMLAEIFHLQRQN